MVRRAARAIDRLKGAMLAAILALCSVLQLTPVTPKGVQCPTAAVQSIIDIVYVKNYSGEMVAQTIQRKPREGDASFLQCRCAEKKAAETRKSADWEGSGRISFLAVLTPQIDFQAQRAVLCQGPVPYHAPPFVLRKPEPLTPPPQFV
jgi:hypothetical protein